MTTHLLMYRLLSCVRKTHINLAKSKCLRFQSELYALMREEEEAALAAAGEPMRNYLVHHIFPTLTPALLEVAKLRPDDPIDFLVRLWELKLLIIDIPLFQDTRHTYLLMSMYILMGIADLYI